MSLKLAKVDKNERPLRISADSLAEIIQNNIQDGIMASMTEEQLRKLFRNIAERVLNNDLDREVIQKLSHAIDIFYNYSDLNDEDERLFDFGACWGATKIYEDAIRLREEASVEEKMQKAIDSYWRLFLKIKRTPGIGHSQLAEYLEYSPSRLSQIMTSLKTLKLVSTVKLGRTKNYYLTQKADEIVSEVEGSSSHIRLSMNVIQIKMELWLEDATNNEKNVLPEALIQNVHELKDRNDRFSKNNTRFSAEKPALFNSVNSFNLMRQFEVKDIAKSLLEY